MLPLLHSSRIALGRRAFSTTPISRYDFAKISILGRLATDPELQSTNSGKEIVRYTVMVTNGKDKATGEEKPSIWFRVANFDPAGPRRDFLLSVPKGSVVFVEGDATFRHYEAGDGSKHSNFSIIQRSFISIMQPKPQPADTWNLPKIE